jgi:hypothetical protein
VTLGIWSIKVLNSDSFVLKPLNESLLENPTLQARDIKDVSAEFIADPFIMCHNSMFYMFFEVLDKTSDKGIIGLATSGDGAKWNYERIVLKESYHLSYPHVFKYKDEVYMTPETIQANGVLLYKAMNFPYDWEIACKLIEGQYVDPSIFQYKDKWWLFAAQNGKLHLFYSNELIGNWIEHPKSPLITDNFNITRPGGRVIVNDGEIYRYTQDGMPNYGSSVKVFKVTNLTESEYEEEEMNEVIKGTNKVNDWKKDGMHTIDQLKITNDKWLIAVDGHTVEKRNHLIWKLNYIVLKISSISFLSKDINRT